MTNMKANMDYKQFLRTFQKAADQLDRKVLQQKQIEVAVGEILNSVFLKLYKRSWTNPSKDPLTSESRIFFSIWINNSAIEEQKLFYNIHALKLRHLEGYAIQSRNFAEAFRDRFKVLDKKWKNVSVECGPLTLMEGWTILDNEKVQEDILKLANSFLAIDHIIDETLSVFKK